MRLSSVFPTLLFLFLFIGGVTARPMWTGQEGSSADKPVASPRPAPVPERLPEIGQSLERDLKEGETHVFTTSIGAGEYLEVTVDQLGIDASVEITDDLGKPVMKIDTPTGAEERETVGLVAVRAGTYSVTIRPVIQQTLPKAGRYRLTLTARRRATAKDQALDKGFRALSGALAEKDAAKVLTQAEAAYATLLPLLGPSHPNVRAAALAYARKAPKDKWLRAAQLAEPILAAREKDDSARPAEVLNWNSITLRGYLNALGDKEVPCIYRETILPLFSREIRLRDQILGPGNSETNSLLMVLSVFHRRCDPDTFPDFMEAMIVEREALLGESHPSVKALLRAYARILTGQTVDRFTDFINRRTESVLANPGVSRRAKVTALLENAQIRRDMVQGLLAEMERAGKSMSDDQPRKVRDFMMRQEREAAEIRQRALTLMETEKGTFQGEYLDSLEEVRRVSPSQLPDYDERLIAFAESIKRLDAIGLLSALEGVAGRLETRIEPALRVNCPENMSETTRVKEKIRRVYEEIFRLAESQFIPPTETTEAGPAPDKPGNDKSVSTPKKEVRTEIDGAALAYARFLFSSGETSAAAEVLERGLAFRLKRDADSISARIVFAAGFDLAGDEKRAADVYGQAQKLAEGVSDERARDKRLLECLPAIAQFHERYGRYDEAESIYRRLGDVTNRISSRKKKDEDDESGGDESALSIPEQGLMWIASARGDEKTFAQQLSVLSRKLPDLMQEDPNTPKPFLLLRTTREWRQNMLMFYAVQYAGFGNRAQTMALIERLTAGPENDPENGSVLWIAGLALMQIRREREALSYFQRSVVARISGDPAGAERHLPLVIKLAEQIDSAENVLVFLERLAVRLEKTPDSKRQLSFVYSQIGRLQELTGHPDQALRTYQRLAEMGGGFVGVSIPIREQIALELWRGGQADSAVRAQSAANDFRESELLAMVLRRLFTRPESASDEKAVLSEGCSPDTASGPDLNFPGELSRTISLHALALPESTAARRAAFESALRRKDRTPESVIESVPDRKLVDALNLEELMMSGRALSESGNMPRNDEISRALFSELSRYVDLTDVRFSHWADRVLRFDLNGFEPLINPESKENRSFHNLVHSFANQVIREHPEFRAWLTPITVEAVQKALPADGALVEVVRYAPFNPKTGTTEGEERYAVYVLTPQGEPKWFDGGTVSEVDQAANLLANEARDYADDESKAATAVLETRFIVPALKLTGNAKRVYVAFDERLASLPLKRLMDAQGKPLGERHGLIFIRSGRELLNSENAR